MSKIIERVRERQQKANFREAERQETRRQDAEAIVTAALAAVAVAALASGRRRPSLCQRVSKFFLG